MDILSNCLPSASVCFFKFRLFSFLSCYVISSNIILCMFISGKRCCDHGNHHQTENFHYWAFTIFWEFLSYQNVCIYQLGWHSINTLASALNCISNKVCEIYIAAILRHMRANILYSYKMSPVLHILTHHSTPRLAIQIPHNLSQC